MVDSNFSNDVNRLTCANGFFANRDFVCHVNTLMQ